MSGLRRSETATGKALTFCVRLEREPQAGRADLATGGAEGSGKATAARAPVAGGKPFARGNLYLLLRNRTYIGEIAHRGQVHAGAHDAILDRETWNQVLDRADRLLCDPILLSRKLGVGHQHLDRIATHAEAIRRRLRHPSADRDDTIRQLLDRLVVDRHRAQFHWSRVGLHRLLGIELKSDYQPNLVEEIAIKVKRQGQGKRIYLPTGEQKSAPNRTLIKAVIRAHAWRRMLESEHGLSVRELAARQRLNHRYINRLLPLAWLSPDVIEAILDGAHLPEISLDQLTVKFPIEWSEQRRLLALGSRR